MLKPPLPMKRKLRRSKAASGLTELIRNPPTCFPAGGGIGVKGGDKKKLFRLGGFFLVDIADKDCHAAFVVWIGKVNAVFAFRGDGEAAAYKVYLVVLHGIKKLGKVLLDVLDLHVQLVGYTVDDFNVHPHEFVICHIGHGNLGWVGGITDGACAAIVILFVIPLGDAAILVNGFTPFFLESLQLSALFQLLDNGAETFAQRVSFAGGKGVAVIGIVEGT